MKKIIQLFDMKGRRVYDFAHDWENDLPSLERRIVMRQRTGVIENIRTGTFFMAVGVVASAAACYFAWTGNLAVAIGLVAVGGLLHAAGSAVSFANERLESVTTEYRERENTREIWTNISRIEDRLEELQTKRSTK
jgi:hypothetical protein